MKRHRRVPAARPRQVAPFTGAWIETAKVNALEEAAKGRPLHGGVD